MTQDSAPRPTEPINAEPSEQVSNAPPIVVKKYANRRLYNTETSSYITLENLAGMVRAGRDFIVYDAKSGDDITRGVLTQIIVEEESKGSAMLPTAFLRQLIAFYGGNLQGVVPQYLDYAMSSFARQQQRMRQVVERTFSPFLPTGVEEMNRQNMALFERAFGLWNPFHPADAKPEDGSEPAPAGQEGAEPVQPAQDAEVNRLRGEVESLQRQLAAAHAAAVVAAHAQASSSAEAQAVPAAPSIPENVLSDPKPPQEADAQKPSRRARNSTAAQS